MLFFDGLPAVPAGFGPSAVTIGKFDGVHLGHRRVLDALRSVATELGLVSTVLTFDRHPLALFNPARCPIPLTSNMQKRELLAATGVDATVMIPFTAEFSAEEPEDFIQRVLVTALQAKVVFVGSTFRFGHGGRGDVAMLTAAGDAAGFEVRSIDQVIAPDLITEGRGERPVSSTLIRERLDAGDVVGAAALLGRAPSVRGLIVHGAERGRELGYPTANFEQHSEGFIPVDGVYAARFTAGGRSMPAAVSIGNNPTFEGVRDKQVEAHVLDENLDLYDLRATVEFIEYVRPMVKFDGIDALIVQMKADEERIRQILNVRAR